MTAKSKSPELQAQLDRLGITDDEALAAALSEVRVVAPHDPSAKTAPVMQANGRLAEAGPDHGDLPPVGSMLGEEAQATVDKVGAIKDGHEPEVVEPSTPADPAGENEEPIENV